MNSLELKKLLVHRIAEINDIHFLDAIKTILDAKTQAQILQLTPEQKNEIAESKAQYEKGLIVSQEELEKELKEWLKEK